MELKRAPFGSRSGRIYHANVRGAARAGGTLRAAPLQSPAMDESRFLQLADQTFRRLQDLLEPIDPDQVDYELAGDVFKLSFANGVKSVLNTQRPTRQLWLAARSKAWHFSYDEATGRWMDDKGEGVELFACLRELVRDFAGATL
ncbi:iron donor protein CyaY [Vulgatibacter incomptus]|uniref:Frataxin CyaY, facilitates iron supply for heme A synthesis or Fe-S cluster assembly n=1 Tax=Vulgatibacter incomptus TaxID=1391653 RepID=A0A0K1PG81_9BACT|nr:iron donor protein CyaY [Vulgatibacter incomptus]AKU92525.1 Frataxin CyaY, facilitates iron supply for heme A synthesis or Fe-S cluster assembly [Vulgatibacter incomptus]